MIASVTLECKSCDELFTYTKKNTGAMRWYCDECKRESRRMIAKRSRDRIEAADPRDRICWCDECGSCFAAVATAFRFPKLCGSCDPLAFAQYKKKVKKKQKRQKQKPRPPVQSRACSCFDCGRRLVIIGRIPWGHKVMCSDCKERWLG